VGSTPSRAADTLRRPETPIASPSSDPVTLGPFVLEHRIGKGGMGEVWRARHRTQHSTVAVKVLTAEGSSRPMFVDSFRNEVRAVAGLEHPHIALVLDHGEVSAAAAAGSGGTLVAGTPYLAMELVEGGDTLAEHMGVLPWYEIERLLRGLLDALAHAHARGVVHRDLKLSNVLYDRRSGTYKLTDFGIAHGLAATGDPFRWGTPAYMPPEQLLGRWWDYGPWTDLYSLGCCAWALLCGSRPFPDEVARTRAQRRLPPLASHVAVPPGLDAWLAQLTDPEPSARYQRAADAAYALHCLVRGWLDSDVLELARAGKRPPTDHTVTLSFADYDHDTEETFVPQKPSPTRLPPMPKGWRRGRAPRSSMRLKGAGLGLWGVRRIPMVGRTAERDTLWDALHEVRSLLVPRLCLITGAAGTGKSRLGEWLCERSHEVGAASFLRAVHSTGGGAAEGLGGMLAAYLRTAGLSAAQIRQRITAAMSTDDQAVDRWDVRAVMDVATPGVDGVPSSFRAPRERHDAVKRFLFGQAQRRPLVVLLDDVDLSPDTLEFAKGMVEEAAPDCPILMVLAARDDRLAERPAERALFEDLARRPHARRIALGPLPPADHRALVEQLLGLDGALARLVEERTAGNPMFAVELVGDWVQRGILVPGPQGFELVPGAEVTVPDDVHATWADRIGVFLRDRPPGDRIALELAALLGQRVETAEWRAACLASGLTVSPDLVSALFSVRLAVPEDGSTARWAFAHAMLRESLERSADEAFRSAALHRACAAVLAKSPDRERLARHLLGAHAMEAALAPLCDAIDARCRAGDYDRADGLLELWEWAAKEARLPPGDLRRMHGLRAAASVHRYKDRPDGVLTACAAIEEGVRTHGWPKDLVAYVRMQQGRLARLAGDYERAVEVFRDGLGRVSDEVTKASLHVRIGQALLHLGRLRDAEIEFRDCLRLANLGGDRVGAGYAWLGLASLSLARGKTADGFAALEQARAAFTEVRHRYGLASSEDLSGELARHAGELDVAVLHYRAAIDQWRQLGTEGAALYADTSLLFVEIERGRGERVAHELERCARTAAGFGDRSLLATIRLAQLTIDALAGNERAWDEHLVEAATILAETRLVSVDLARIAGQAALAATRRGWESRADDLWSLAWGQWTVLGRTADAERVKAAAGG
jgi:serine/threonine protein kinase/tetratricopeptide (TPR) repeat protein